MFTKIKGAINIIKKANTVKKATSGNNEEAEEATKKALLFGGIIVLAPFIIIFLIFIFATSAFGYDMNMMQSVEDNTSESNSSTGVAVTAGSTKLTDDVWQKMLGVINELDGSGEDYYGPGHDCSWFAYTVYKGAGLDIPRAQCGENVTECIDDSMYHLCYTNGSWTTDPDEMKPGYLVFFKNAGDSRTSGHVAIYGGVENGKHIIYEDTTSRSFGSGIRKSNLEMYKGTSLTFLGGGDPTYSTSPLSGDEVSVSSSYKKELIAKAERNGSETNYLITADCDNYIMAILEKSGNSWKILGTYPINVGPHENGRSISMNWKQDTIKAKYSNAGAGDNVNPWQNSIDGDQKGFSIHGGWADVKTYTEGAGRPDWTPGGIVCDNGPAKWIYDNVPLGTKVVVFDNVDPK